VAFVPGALAIWGTPGILYAIRFSAIARGNYVSETEKQIIDRCYELYYLWAKGADYKFLIHHIIPLLYKYDRKRAEEAWDRATTGFNNRNGKDS
jgi:hypothetical protein